MNIKDVSGQLIRNRITGEIMDLEKVEPSNRKQPPFKDFRQIPPSGASFLASCTLPASALRVFFAMLHFQEVDNIVTLSPGRCYSLTGIKPSNYAASVNLLLEAGLILRVYKDPKVFRYWINPQVSWKGFPDHFWAVDDKFRHITLHYEKLVPGGLQQRIQLEDR